MPLSPWLTESDLRIETDASVAETFESPPHIFIPQSREPSLPHKANSALCSAAHVSEYCVLPRFIR